MLGGADIVLLTETFQLEELHLLGMRGFHQLASRPARGGPGRPKGGLSVYLREDLPHFQCLRKDEYGLILSSGGFNLAVFYLPPDLDLIDVTDIVSEAITGLDLKLPTVVGGDFNCRIDECNGDNRGKGLLELLGNLGFWCANAGDDFTYVCASGRSTIDLLFHNLVGSNEFRDLRVLETTVRKHLPVQATVVTSALGCRRRNVHSTFRTRLIDEAALARQVEELEALEDVDSGCRSLEQVMQAAGVVRRRHSRRSRPWFSRECYQKRAEVLGHLRSSKAKALTRDEQAHRSYFVSKPA